MKIYLDNEYKCHTSNETGFTEIETDVFDGKCKDFIEGHMFIPQDSTYTFPDGTVVHGEMITAWKDYAELDNAQREYERQLLTEYEAALANSIPLSELEASYQEGVNGAYD